jgi:hypothetical protein
MVSLLLELDHLPTVAELRGCGVFQMQVTLDPAHGYLPLTLILRFKGPHALYNAQRFVEDHDTMVDEFVLTTGSG